MSLTKAGVGSARTPEPRRLADPSAALEAIDIVVQPIIDVTTGSIVAAEALARFPNVPDVQVEEVFAAAQLFGYGHALEAACLRAALAARPRLPGGVLLFTNLSPDVLCDPAIAQCWPADLAGVVVEVTEQNATHPDRFRAEVERLRRQGALIAIDDVNSGYAGLLRLARLHPDYVKIDRAVVTGMQGNAAQTAVLDILVDFSHRLGAAVIGEGVEDLADLRSLAQFDVDFAQGWAVARPEAVLPSIPAAVVETCVNERRHVLGKLNGHRSRAAAIRATYRAMAALRGAVDLSGISDALDWFAQAMGIDAIGLSMLSDDGGLREVASSRQPLDSRVYALCDYPATRQAIEFDRTLEVHVADLGADPAERALLVALGRASLLLAPVHGVGGPLGVLEFVQRTPRRWTTMDIAHARGLAEQLITVHVRG